MKENGLLEIIAAYRFGMEDGVRLCAEIEKITCPQK